MKRIVTANYEIKNGLAADYSRPELFRLPDIFAVNIFMLKLGKMIQLPLLSFSARAKISPHLLTAGGELFGLSRL